MRIWVPECSWSPELAMRASRRAPTKSPVPKLRSPSTSAVLMPRVAVTCAMMSAIVLFPTPPLADTSVTSGARRTFCAEYAVCEAFILACLTCRAVAGQDEVDGSLCRGSDEVAHARGFDRERDPGYLLVLGIFGSARLEHEYVLARAS